MRRARRPQGGGFRRSHLLALFEEARRLTGHDQFVVIGSLSILGLHDEDALPAEMAMSNDIDAFTKADPDRIFDLSPKLGEGSGFHQLHGFYLDPVSPRLPTLPEGWALRMSKLENNGLTLWFLDSDDAAVSKLARSQPDDLRWIRAGVRLGLVSLAKVAQQLASTLFMDGDEERRVRATLAQTQAWFDDMRADRAGRSTGGA